MSTQDHHLNKLRSPNITGLLVPEKKILKGFTIYGRDSHLAHVTKIFCIHFSKPIIRSLPKKFEFKWANGL